MKGKLTLTCLCIALLFQISVYAQFKRISSEPDIKNDLSSVIQDYQNKFINITGSVVDENPQTTEYLSTVWLTGASECKVTRYSSGKNNVFSWQALMFVSEDFEEASAKFKKLFKQLNNLHVKFGNYKDYRFTASFIEPAEELEFTSIIFLNDANEAKKLKLELNINYEFPEWKVKIVLYEKEREDNEMGRQADTDDYIEY
ncbi:MAG: hypothetical protein H0V30_05200 [Chitinophagaceae bacterium]|jgi:hypothetical protein|nr:hypothetical protein [Chitinophagaceae bacterium]